MIVKGSPFDIDWRNKDEVIQYCKRFGPGHVVIEMVWPDNSSKPGLNYNITHTERVEDSIKRLIKMGAISGKVVYPIQ